MAEDKFGAENVRWDLGIFYSGLNDPQINKDLEKLADMAKEFNGAHKGKLAQTLDKAISDFAELEMLGDKIGVYLFLLQTLDTANAEVNAKFASTQEALSQISGEYLEFFKLELVELDDATLAKFYASSPIAAKHKPWIDHARVFRPHLLSEPVESALTKRGPFGSSAWAKLFQEFSFDLRFDFLGEKKNLMEMIKIVADSKDANERAEALRLVNEGLGGMFSKYSAETLYMTTGSIAVEVRERNYANPMERRNKNNRITSEAVEALHRAVMEQGSVIAQRYYRLKARHLGLKTLKWSDRNAPMPFRDTTVIPFDSAMQTVLEAYDSFSPTLAGIIRDFVAEKRIDAPATKGKRGGAFNASIVLPGNQPVSFTLLNYLGTSYDVMLIAHELGHGVHGILAGQAQGRLMFDAPIAYAETASVFGELTTFNFLKKRLLAEGNREALLALLMDKIDNTINTVIRQISFSNFERRLHGMNETYSAWSKPQKLSAEKLDELWLKTTKELYGPDGDVFTYENTNRLWSYIPHFHSPFYVYGYSFGLILSASLYAVAPKFGDKFEPLYLDLLRAGGTKDVTELLRPFELDAANDDFWNNGIDVSLGAMVREAEELSR